MTYILKVTRRPRHRLSVPLMVLCTCFLLAAAGASAQEISELPAPRKYSASDQAQMSPPTPDRVFRLESEAMLMDRMRKEAEQDPDRHKVMFPTEPAASTEVYAGRHWAPLVETIEPAYVCYGRLYFEQKNSERYGWDLGILHPLLSAGHFYFDVLTLPYRLGTEPRRHYECSAGYCLPGDPVPLLLYPPQISVSGALTQTATIGLLFAIFP